ncbi:hypothetical protein QOZ80_9BG0709690 [Eleusine coracana subsp. coracana]|nr:hypothetical protein QOZ80_9BG0709690 [Eleusine coracana subsp. coracana]
MDAGAGTSGEMFDRRSHERSRLEFDAGVTPWAGLQPDNLGIVLRLLPCRTIALADHVSVRINDLYVMSLRQVVLSASPESRSKYIIAASSYLNLAFYLRKLYVLYAFELEEDDRGVIVSHVERCVTQPLLPHSDRYSKGCNMVVWRENLLLIIRYYSSYIMREIVKVEVFAVDFSTDPKGFIKINNLDGDCIFVDSGCKSFPANLHDKVKCDHIYFLRDDFSRYGSFVYNMRDGRMSPFAVNLLLRNIEEDNLDFPVWLFPSDAAELI